MPPTNDAHWDRWRNAIHTLYVLEKRPLEGKHGVIGIMKEKHQFEASKSQYERRLAKWGFVKKTKKESWQIGAYKVKKRETEGKETLVYRDGVLIPPDKAAKEFTRQGHMTALESARMANGPTPRTPADFDFRTPSEDSVVRLELEGLPVLQYLRTVLGLADSFPGSTPSSASDNQAVLAPDTIVHQEPVRDSALVGLNIPLSTLEDGALQASPFQEACRMAFTVSNNLPGDLNKSHVYQWLERQVLPASTDRTLFSGSTGQALLEKLFSIAVEMGHLGAVTHLLAAGADPNMSLCSAPHCPVMLTPLQYACLTGNTPLVRVLYNAGALISDNPFGWQGPILVLVILRYHLKPRFYLHENHHSCFGNYVCRSSCYSFNLSTRRVRSAILDLVNILLSFGADVNTSSRWVNGCREAAASNEEYRGLAYTLAFEAHSPLTIAAAYNLTELVKVFLREGADVHYRVNGVSSPLQQSICPFHHVSLTKWSYCVARPPLNEIPPRDPDTVDTVKALIMGGASPDPCDVPGHYRPYEHLPCWPLDEALICGSAAGDKVANILISKGASLTVHTLRLAVILRRDFYIFRQLVGLLSTSSDRTRRLLDGRDLDVFGLTYSKDTFSNRDVYRTLVLAGLTMASEAGFQDLLLSNPFPDVLSDCDFSYLKPYMPPDEGKAFHGKMKLLKSVGYLGATPDFIEGLRQKVISEGLVLPMSMYPVIDATTREDEGPHGDPAPPPHIVTPGPEAPTVVSNSTPSPSRSADCCCDFGHAIESRDWSLVFQLRRSDAPLKPKCRYHHAAPLTSLILDHAPLELIQSFLEGGADPNYAVHDIDNIVGVPVSSGWCVPMYRAIMITSNGFQEALILLLLQYGADPELVMFAPGLRFFDTAMTPVMLAIERDVLRVAEILFDHGAGPNWHPSPKVLYSPLQLVAYLDREAWVRLFLDKGADPNDERPDLCNRRESIYYDTGDYIGAPIQSAAVAGNLTMVDMLLKANAHPDLTTPLTPHTALQIACRKKSDAIANLLIEYGADINAPPAEHRGATALQFAAINCRLELAQMLVQKGANVNAPPAAYEGRTALEGAAEHGRIDMVQYLVNVGADISGDQYERALQRSRNNGHFATWNLLASYLS